MSWLRSLRRRLDEAAVPASDPPDKRFSEPAGHGEPWQSEAADELRYLRHSLVVLRPREPYVRWARKVDPRTNFDYNLLQARREDGIAFLIPQRFGSPEDSEAFIADFWGHFFAQALEQIEQDRARWPSDRTLAMFRHWFDIELCQAVLDLGGDEED